MAHIRFSRDSDEVACGKSIPLRFSRGERFLVGCMRTKGHKGKCVSMTCDAAKADGVCWGCRARAGESHRTVYGFKGKRVPCDAMNFLVECAFCLARFESAVPFVSYMHGADCASHIDVWPRHGTVLLSGYGSAYDFETFKFVGMPVGFEDADPVCDGCIRSFIEQGALRKIEGEYPLGVS
jgi:hypothetical protein